MFDGFTEQLPCGRIVLHILVLQQMWGPWPASRCCRTLLEVWQPKRAWTSRSLKGHETDGGDVPPQADVWPFTRKVIP